VNAGFTSEATTKDYGYDLAVNTFDRDGVLDPLPFLIRLKASEILAAHPDGVGSNALRLPPRSDSGAPILAS